MSDPNSFDDVSPDVDAPANPPGTPEGTEKKEEIDYVVKFSESSKEANRLLEENRQKDAIIADLNRQLEEGKPPKSAPVVPISNAPDGGDDVELFPGFSALDEDAQRNVLALVDATTRRATQEVMNDPAIAHSRSVYNETKWREAFDAVKVTFPDLVTHADDFKSKYYNPKNVPDNIQDVLLDLAKIYLFDKAKEIGAAEERERGNQIDLEDVNGGDKGPTVHRSLDDWQKMASENPAKFASLAKEYQEDVAAGRI